MKWFDLYILLEKIHKNILREMLYNNYTKQSKSQKDFNH